jgi:hypothetical protein
MEGIFQGIGETKTGRTETLDGDVTTYEVHIKSLIEDAQDFNDSDLSPNREQAIKYYHGLSPALNDDIMVDGDITGDPAVDDDDVNQSEAISTDVRDTVLAIMPSLMRIFTSAEHVVYFTPSTQDQVEAAKQQTDYIENVFWEENDGFLILHDVFKDAMIQKIGIVKWWTEDQHIVRQKKFQNITIVELSNLLQEYNSGSADEQKAEVLNMEPSPTPGMLATVTVRYVESTPKHTVESVPPEEFRIDRRAKSVRDSRLVGHQTLVTPSYLISRGVDPEVIEDYRGSFDHYSPEADLRQPGIETSVLRQDLIEYGEYFIYVDQDEDGIDELHRVCVIGQNYDIIEDEIVDDVNFALFCGDPEPHTAIGSSVSDLVMDIQKINTQILRGSLDSLSRAMNPDIVFNEMTTNAEDVLASGVGRVIRTRGDPGAAFSEIKYDFVGDEAFAMMTTMDGIRQRRTGISEASKGIDPKALQSTNQMGVEAIVTGAQERIELIARIFAETGLKDMFKGLLREVVRNPNKEKTIQIRGQWVSMNPSIFDPNLRCKVNPTMGKGSDTTRLMALQDIKQTQLMIMEKFGIGNTMVTPEHFMNTQSDIMAIANIKDITRYFAPMAPEQIKAIQEAPKEPSAEDKIAMAELEKVKAQTAGKIADNQHKQEQSMLDEDFRRDKLALDTLSKMAVALAKTDLGTIESAAPFVRSQDQNG